MAGKEIQVAQNQDSDSDDEVFAGPITKKELLASIKYSDRPWRDWIGVTPPPKNYQKQSVHDAAVTPAKASNSELLNNITPLDLSAKTSSPVVVDLTTPATHKTILISDTPRPERCYNDSDFMDESEIGISVDQQLKTLDIDLSESIGAEIEADLKLYESQQNSNLHLNTFFNTSGDVSNLCEGNNKLPNITMNTTHNSANVTNGREHNFSNESENVEDKTKFLCDDTETSLDQNSIYYKSTIFTTSRRNSNLSSPCNGTFNTSNNISSDNSGASPNIDDNSNTCGDELSESFQYVSQSRLLPNENKENEVVTAKKNEDELMNSTFEKLSLSNRKSLSEITHQSESAMNKTKEPCLSESFENGISIADDSEINKSNSFNETQISEHNMSGILNESVSGKSKMFNSSQSLKMSMLGFADESVLNRSKSFNQSQISAHSVSLVLDESAKGEGQLVNQSQISEHSNSAFLDESTNDKRKSVNKSQISELYMSAVFNESGLNKSKQHQSTIPEKSVNPVDDTLEEIDILEKYGYKTAAGSSGDSTTQIPPHFDEDDLNKSVIDNNEASNYWKEVNSLNNTEYIDLSPIKESPKEALCIPGEHDYMVSLDSGDSGDEIVEGCIVNYNDRKLRSITEEHDACENKVADVTASKRKSKDSAELLDFGVVARKAGVFKDNSRDDFCPFEEAFAKPRNITNDETMMDLNSPSMQEVPTSVKKSFKPSQIPMAKRNILKPAKFNPISNLPKPPMISNKENSTSKQIENLKTSSKDKFTPPGTPNRSLTHTLRSTLSSIANRITGRTPLRQNNSSSVTKSTMKSPQPPKSGTKPFSPTFKNVPSSTPAVKSKTPVPYNKFQLKTPAEQTDGKCLRKSLSASKVEGLHNRSTCNTSLNNRKLDFKNVESKVGSIRKPDELVALQKAIKSPINVAVTTKPQSLIKPAKLNVSKLPKLSMSSVPTKRPSKYMGVQSPIGAYIRNGAQSLNDCRKNESSYIPRKLQKVNQKDEGHMSNSGSKVTASNNDPSTDEIMAEPLSQENVNSSQPICDESMTELLPQEILQSTAL